MIDLYRFFPLYSNFQNGTKESISKLVADLNNAKLEDDVGKLSLILEDACYHRFIICSCYNK